MTQNGDLGELLRIPFIGKKSRKSKSDREFLSLRATAVCIRENQSLEPQNPHQKTLVWLCIHSSAREVETGQLQWLGDQ